MELTARDQLDQRLTSELETLRREGRVTTPSVLAGAQGPRIEAGGRSFINLCANNYLGLANDPQVIAAARAALDRYGFGSGGGRLVATLEPQLELERRLSTFKRRDAALVCQTGYDTNLAALSTLFGEGDILLSDASNHASIVDGMRLSRAERRIYPHGDMNALETLLHANQGARALVIVTDGVFSMDGDLAPLPEIVALAERYGALVYVDDAHGDGVLGKTGSGVVEHFGLHGHVALEVGTLSKALGGVGGFVAADQPVIDYLFQRARPFVFSTGHLPPMVAAGLVAGLDVLSAQPDRLERLWSNATYLRAGLQRLGLNTGASVTPIIPVVVGTAERAIALKQALLDTSVYVQAFATPVVPEGAARVRVIVSAAHTRADLDEALAAFAAATRALRLDS
jgi:glycine C-acetyltransferase